MSSSNQPTAPVASGSGSGSGTGPSSTPSTSGREIRVFLPPSSSAPVTIPPISDDELKPTASELKSAFRSSPLLHHGPDAPLLTRALREREEARLGLHASRNRSYPSIRIRVRFSDRTMIESTFHESDTIESVYQLLDAALDDDARAKPVVIYTSPPKTEYRRHDRKVQGKTLRELGLIPSAVVSLRWEDAAMNSNAFPAPLRHDLKASAQPLPLPVPDQPQASTDSAAAKSEPKPMPRWLKNIVSKSLMYPSLSKGHGRIGD